MRIFPQLLAVFFIVFWALFIFLDYWQKHPSYYYSFAYFHYWGLALTLLIIGAGASWLVLKFGKDKRQKRNFTGLPVFALFLLISVISVGAAFNALAPDASFNAARAGIAVFKVGGAALAVFLVTCASYVLGSFINDFLKIKIAGMGAPLTAIASGMMGLVMFCFLLGAVSLLHAFVLYPCLAALFILGRKKAIVFLKTTLWQPLATDGKLNLVGVGSFYLLIVLFSINFTAVNVPMPPGFDSLTVYANLPSLIGGRHGLVEGFQPYNWSILMSLGHVLFGSTAVSLALSNLGGVLAAFAMYALCRNGLKMDANYSLLAVLAVSLTPAITVQSFAELKVDLGLLFITLCILLVFLTYLKRSFGPEKETLKPAPGKAAVAKKAGTSPPGFFSKTLLSSPEIVWMGLLTGFAMGIKLTTTFFAFALLASLWYVHGGKRGFWAMFLACLFLVFFMKLDDFGGLRQFHLGVGILQWGVLAASLLLFAGVFLAHREHFQQSLKLSLIYGAFAFFTFVPWVVKNYAETRSLSPSALMNGKAASPGINLQILENNLRNNGN